MSAGGQQDECTIRFSERSPSEQAPNGSRLSCGRNTRRRKVVEGKRRRGGEATQLFPTCERP
jgi:hypothetical protein